MSMKYRELANEFPELSKSEILELMNPVYEKPGRTKQSFKDSTDINKILQKAQKAGSLSHWQKHGAFYADLADLPTDPFEAREVLNRAHEIFQEMPSEIKKEFHQDPLEFARFASDPENAGRIPQLLPELAKPGRYWPDVSPYSPPDALLGDKPAPAQPEAPAAESPPEEPSGG